MTYSHPKESAHAQDAREAKEHALGLESQSLLRVGYRPDATTEIERMATALQDISAERQRQMSVEGWTPEHDDTHSDGAMAKAAGTYAICAGSSQNIRDLFKAGDAMPTWPWDQGWWKPTNRRRDLVKAGALIVAEIERLDRLERANT